MLTTGCPNGTAHDTTFHRETRTKTVKASRLGMAGGHLSPSKRFWFMFGRGWSFLFVPRDVHDFSAALQFANGSSLTQDPVHVPDHQGS